MKPKLKSSQRLADASKPSIWQVISSYRPHKRLVCGGDRCGPLRACFPSLRCDPLMSTALRPCQTHRSRSSSAFERQAGNRRRSFQWVQNQPTKAVRNEHLLPWKLSCRSRVLQPIKIPKIFSFVPSPEPSTEKIRKSILSMKATSCNAFLWPSETALRSSP